LHLPRLEARNVQAVTQLLYQKKLRRKRKHVKNKTGERERKKRTNEGKKMNVNISLFNVTGLSV
jgi:hypothetical protein